MVSKTDESFQKKLLAWFSQNGRDLPWRKTCDPYRIWISEIMLQQTQVKTVLPYFLRWIERFPDPAAVAAADERDILLAWEGLGYYSRARNIHRTARLLVREFKGKVPADHDPLLKLPGIGRYTAGAIMSIAFNKDFAAVDANAARIFRRAFSIGAPVSSNSPVLWDLAREKIPKGKARYFNQALMDLGAMVCLPESPRCADCPVCGSCETGRLGLAAQEIRKPSRAATPISVAVGILMRDGKIYIQKRPENGLMPNLWEFPGGKLQDGETPEEAVMREIREELGLEVSPVEKIAFIRHSYTTFRVALHAYLCEILSGELRPEPRAASESRWVNPEELDRYPFPAANRRLIRALMGGGGWFGERAKRAGD
jgi:A/G-specific adenine glycosylase